MKCLFKISMTSLIDINELIFRVSEISFLIFLSQNVAQLSVKQKLDCIRERFTSIKFSVLVMWKNAQPLQMKDPMSHF